MGAPLCSFCWTLMIFDGSALPLSLTHTLSLYHYRSCLLGIPCYLLTQPSCFRSGSWLSTITFSLFLVCFLVCYFAGKCKSNCTSLHLHTRIHNTCTLCIN